jgi:hypothetical protein
MRPVVDLEARAAENVEPDHRVDRAQAGHGAEIHYEDWMRFQTKRPERDGGHHRPEGARLMVEGDHARAVGDEGKASLVVTRRSTRVHEAPVSMRNRRRSQWPIDP